MRVKIEILNENECNGLMFGPINTADGTRYDCVYLTPKERKITVDLDENTVYHLTPKRPKPVECVHTPENSNG